MRFRRNGHKMPVRSRIAVQPRALPLISRQSLDWFHSIFLARFARLARTATRFRRNGYKIPVRSPIAVQAPARTADFDGEDHLPLVPHTFGCLDTRSCYLDRPAGSMVGSWVSI